MTSVANIFSDDVSVLLNQGDGTFAAAVEFTDKDAWIAAVRQFNTIDFTGFADGTFITNQNRDDSLCMLRAGWQLGTVQPGACGVVGPGRQNRIRGG